MTLDVDDSWNNTLIIVLVLHLYLFLFWVYTVSRVVAFQPGHFFVKGGGERYRLTMIQLTVSWFKRRSSSLQIHFLNLPGTLADYYFSTSLLVTWSTSRNFGVTLTTIFGHFFVLFCTWRPQYYPLRFLVLPSKGRSRVFWKGITILGREGEGGKCPWSWASGLWR